MSLPSPLLLLFLAVSCAFSQELTFLRLPYVSLSSSSSSLPINQLDSLIANVLGVPSSLSWPGLTSSSGLQRAKANLLFVVDGLSTPAALHFPRGIPVDGDSNNNDDGVSVEARFRALTQRLQSAFQDSPSPLVLTNDAAPHYETEPGHFETSIIHFPMSEGVSEVSGASERVSAAEGASEASSLEQVYE